MPQTKPPEISKVCEAEIDRQKAEDVYKAAEENTQQAFECLNESAKALNISLANIQLLFSTSTESDSSQGSLPPTPRTPSRSHTSITVITPGHSPVPCTPGGSIRSTSVVPEEELLLGCKSTRYVVYLREGKCDGIFLCWRDLLLCQLQGAASVVENYQPAVYKGFKNSSLAESYYAECKRDGVLDVLKEEPSAPKHPFFYIVTRGVQPRVYNNRLQLMLKGLQWRRGLVTTFKGPKHEADALFQEWLKDGYVERLAVATSTL
ncbi:hypothetical protein Moror_15402 [Moniliophthora roreri MCA 2997]|uniref:Uncharacterized protein n=1 Tax=Moniliophthora roreri (strain MCA 2997) TaxID=1381753 RepID=V2WP00_MONRO|nr:hypothetical protein Moror_15402 [Moniliophthora roreri MCA 2997]